MAAWTPSNTPRSSMRILPPPPSSAGVPSTRTVMPRSSATRGQAQAGADRRGGDDVVAAGMADAGQGVVLGADRHHQRPGPGLGAEGGGQVGRPPPVTANPPSASASAVQAAAWSSSKAVSGWAWMVWLSCDQDVERGVDGGFGAPVLLRTRIRRAGTGRSTGSPPTR